MKEKDRNEMINNILGMKVFKMNECDWMAANSIEEAMTEYREITSCDEDEIDAERCSPDETMWYGFNYEELEKFLENEKGTFEIMKDRTGEHPTVLKLKFSKVIEMDKPEKPYIIASTEY